MVIVVTLQLSLFTQCGPELGGFPHLRELGAGVVLPEVSEDVITISGNRTSDVDPRGVGNSRGKFQSVVVDSTTDLLTRRAPASVVDRLPN